MRGWGEGSVAKNATKSDPMLVSHRAGLESAGVNQDQLFCVMVGEIEAQELGFLTLIQKGVFFLIVGVLFVFLN